MLGEGNRQRILGGVRSTEFPSLALSDIIPIIHETHFESEITSTRAGSSHDWIVYACADPDLLARCSGGCPGLGIRNVHYQFALVASGADTTPDRIRGYDCVVAGFFQLPKPIPVSGTARFPVVVTRHLQEQRGNRFETTSADSSISEAVLEYTGWALTV